jgi:hypothetical protein
MGNYITAYEDAVRHPITRVEFAIAELVSEPLLAEKSWILSGLSTHYDLLGYAMLSPEMRKDASLGVLFSDVPTPDDGVFTLELGIPLPDLFPNCEGRPEYSLRVKTDAGDRDVCISNVMARLRYLGQDKEDGSKEHSLHALIPRRALPKVRKGEVPLLPKDASVELLRTFATCRYEIRGTSAEDAFEAHCYSSIQDMTARLNRILKCLPFVELALGRVYSIAYTPATLGAFYFIIKGASEENLGHGWIASHSGRTVLNPSDLPLPLAVLLREYVSGTKCPDDIEALLHSVQSYIDAGVIEYVLLLSVIAAEVATQRFVHKRLLASQVTPKKLEEVEKDLTYSMMLNVVLFAVTPDDRKPDKNLIGRMNRARKLRNEYMHSGCIPHDHKEVIELFHSTTAFVAYLRNLDNDPTFKTHSESPASPDAETCNE